MEVFRQNPMDEVIENLEDANSTYHRDIMDAHAAQEARAYKIRTQSAMNAAMHRESQWGETYDRWLENREKLEAIQKGLLEPAILPGEFAPEWAAYSAGVQVASLGLAGVLVALGAWPVALCTVPGALLYNFLWLQKQKKLDAEKTP